MNYFIGVVAIVFCFLSCTKDIEVEQPAYEQKVVVDGWIENGDFAHVLLTKSSAFLTHYDSASIRNTFLNYAKVTVSNSKGESEILTLIRKDEFFPPFIYRTMQLKGEIGETYYLNIEADGKVIESTTSIPDVPNVLRVLSVPVSDTTMNIEVNLLDKQEEVKFYYSEIKTNGVDSNFHPSSFPLYNNNSFNGEITSIKILRSNQPDPLNIYNIDSKRNLPCNEFSIEDTVYVKFASIDENAFKVLNDLYIDQLNSGNPFSFVDKKTSTNINGGIGRWTGLATKIYVVFNSNN